MNRRQVICPDMISNGMGMILDSVRDPEIWAKTKKGAEEARGFTFDLIRDLAKGLAKKQIEGLTGVKL